MKSTWEVGRPDNRRLGTPCISLSCHRPSYVTRGGSYTPCSWSYLNTQGQGIQRLWVIFAPAQSEAALLGPDSLGPDMMPALVVLRSMKAPRFQQGTLHSTCLLLNEKKLGRNSIRKCRLGTHTSSKFVFLRRSHTRSLHSPSQGRLCKMSSKDPRVLYPE